ncbi:hypothetical protein L208DRAFT_1264669, partial [Tricholoma matsutake]
GDVRLLVCGAALSRINAILGAWGWGNAFGHSFCIGGTLFFLAQGVSPEIVCIAGHWKLLAYQVYI